MCNWCGTRWTLSAQGLCPSCERNAAEQTRKGGAARNPYEGWCRQCCTYNCSATQHAAAMAINNGPRPSTMFEC